MFKVLKYLSYYWKNIRVNRTESRQEGHYFFCSLSLGFLSLFNGIYKALFVLFSIKAMGNFCCFNDVFIYNNRFNFVSSSSTIVQMRPGKQNGIFLRQRQGWFDIEGTYLFESAGFYIFIQSFVPVLFVIKSKNGKFIVLLSMVTCKLGFTWFKIVCKSLGSVN